jgi:hypothetical protein
MPQNKNNQESTDEMILTCKFIRDELKQGFNDLKKLRNSGEITEADLQYELSRDRKAGLIFKSIAVELTVEKVKNKRMTFEK